MEGTTVKRLNNMTIKMKPVAAAVALTLAAGPVWAVQDFYLATKAYDKALPDGTSVPMWGYVLDDDNNGNRFKNWSLAGGG